ncbi:MAG: LacI family DNA-binding transcriptional regulator, partial [Clostridiales bacterium]|nr:LacI family DNA-binding transcriptional regulator [Clostridiales bacterium]
DIDMAIKRAKEIAKEIGFSASTLSLVLNGKPGISEKTRIAVVNRLQELGYGYMLEGTQDSADNPAVTIPANDTAVNSENSGTIGFVLYKNEGKLLGFNSFFPLILEGIESTARRYGYSLVVINIEREHINQQINYIEDANCLGYVIFATELHLEDLKPFQNLGIPFVLLDNYFRSLSSVNAVKVNNEQGTYEAVRYLYDLGHRNIGYLSSGLDICSFHEREMFALSAIRELTGTSGVSYTIGYAHENAEHGMSRLLSSGQIKKMPTAFLSDNDLVAIGAIQALKKAGYHIPEDISIIGYDDRPICTIIDPPLTTIQLPRTRFGSEAIEQLIRFMRMPSDSYTKVEINGILIKRDSVRDITASTS